ncbi:hypothetical protein AGMMS50267_01020 [Spirochaetia bacterium]|nr:hypothetical protein AGMMS50267_01020 [Spirochaetia bacterium]
MKTTDTPPSEAFLRAREKCCVSACFRFLRRGSGDHLWFLPNTPGETLPSALLIHHRRMLFPVFCGRRDIPIPRFMERFLRKIAIHAIQGSRDDTEILEAAILRLGYEKSDQFDYDLMSLDRPPAPASLRTGPASLILKRPAVTDIDELFPLQAAYEQEEVLPRGAEFNPASSRLSLQHILERNGILAAWLDGRIVGKINTNAESFTRLQIGGVYVHPGFRGQGIATRMTAALAGDIIAEGKQITLFVKKRNAAARAVYRRAGFEMNGDYRICYY